MALSTYGPAGALAVDVAKAMVRMPSVGHERQSC